MAYTWAWTNSGLALSGCDLDHLIQHGLGFDEAAGIGRLVHLVHGGFGRQCGLAGHGQAKAAAPLRSAESSSRMQTWGHARQTGRCEAEYAPSKPRTWSPPVQPSVNHPRRDVENGGRGRPARSSDSAGSAARRNSLRPPIKVTEAQARTVEQHGRTLAAAAATARTLSRLMDRSRAIVTWTAAWRNVLLVAGPSTAGVSGSSR